MISSRILSGILLMTGAPSLYASELVFREGDTEPYSEIFLSPSSINAVPFIRPTLIRGANTPIEYPAGSRNNEQAGAVYLWVEVLSSGSVNEVSVAVSSGHPSLDTAAVDHAKAQWQFDPAMLGWRPVDVRILMKQQFRIEGMDLEFREKAVTQSTLVGEAFAEEQAAIATLRQQMMKSEPDRIAREQPYRLRPTKLLSDSEMAVRAFQVFHNFLYCEDSVYEVLDGGIHQIKGFRLDSPKNLELTKIDRANGYEWRGWIGYIVEMAREYQGVWEDWYEGEPSSRLVYKRNGRWYVRTDVGDRWSPETTTCSDVP